MLFRSQSHERFTLSDMLDHLQTIEKMGPLHSLVEMIPGLAVAVSADALDARAFKRQKAIIQSMTVQERDNFLIIGPSRRRRIAAGSGTSVADVNRLIKNFERMRTLMRKTAWQSRRAHPKGDTPYGWPHR